MAFNWKGLVKSIAPSIATALGGPMAGVAVSRLSTAILGKADGTEDEVASALANASPDTLLKIKEMDQTFAKEMADLNVKLEEIDAGDRADARKRQVAMRDWTPNILAGMVICFYGVVQIYVLGHALPKESEIIITRTLGTLDALVMTVVAYFFGSSRSSRAKDDVISSMSQR